MGMPAMFGGQRSAIIRHRRDMNCELKSYVNLTPDGGCWIIGTRVSVDSVIHEYLDGETPETIAAHYPSLSLEQVYGAITFYLANRAEIDAYLKTRETLWKRSRSGSETSNAALLERLRNARRQATNRSGQTYLPL